jgi:hypothetical protein
VVIGSHVQEGGKEQVQAKATSLGVNYSISIQTHVKDGNDFNGIPHCMLFDHTGKCIYRGSPSEVEKDLVAAVGKALGDGIDKPGTSIAPLLEALAKGQQTPANVLQRAVPLLKSPNAQTAQGAAKLVENLTAGARKKVEDADTLKSTDPLEAFGMVEKIPVTFKGTAVATKAADLLTELKKDKAVQAELKARPSLDAVRKLDAALTQTAEQARVTDLKDPKFLKATAPTIDQLKRALQQMNKSYPDAKATQQASVIGEKYGVTVK